MPFRVSLPVFAKAYVTFSVFTFLALSSTFKGSYSLSGSIMLLGCLFLLSSEIRNKITLSKYEKGLIVVLVLYFLSVLMEVWYFELSINRAGEASKALLLAPCILLLNFAKIEFKTVALGLIVGCFGLLTLGLYEHAYLVKWRIGTNINPIRLGSVAAIYATMLLLYIPLIYQKIKYGKYLAIFAVIGVCGAFYTSGLTISRGAFIPLPILVLIIAYCYRRQIAGKAKTAIIIFVLIVTTGAIWLPSTSVVSRFDTAIKNFDSYFFDGNSNTSTGVRLELWKSGLIIASQSPIIGVGFEGFQSQKSSLVQQGKIAPSVDKYDNAHSAYVNALVRRGILGLAVIIIFIGFPVYIGVQKLRQRTIKVDVIALSLVVFGVYFAVSNITLSFYLRNGGVILYSGMLIILVALFANSYRDQEKNLPEKTEEITS